MIKNYAERKLIYRSAITVHCVFNRHDYYCLIKNIYKNNNCIIIFYDVLNFISLSYQYIVIIWFVIIFIVQTKVCLDNLNLVHCRYVKNE
jgi:hypothetical protein